MGYEVGEKEITGEIKMKGFGRHMTLKYDKM